MDKLNEAIEPIGIEINKEHEKIRALSISVLYITIGFIYTVYCVRVTTDKNKTSKSSISFFFKN